MRFNFKRKYTSAFFLFIVLIGISISFYLIGPSFIEREQRFFNQILLISLIDSVFITIFIIGLSRATYYLYHDGIEIHRSFHKTVNLSYQNIEQVTENKNDKTFLVFGPHPSLKIKYKKGAGFKKYCLRVEKHDLLKLVLENEHKIHITENK